MYPLAFSTLGCPDWTFEQAADVAVANGYTGIEIRLLDNEIISADLPPEEQERVRRVLAERRLNGIGLGASTRFSSPDESERRAQQEDLRRYLQLANRLEVPMVRTFAGEVAEGATLDETVDWLAGSLAELMPDAERYGVTIMLETHDAFCRGQEVARVLEQVPDPRLQVIWDVHHPFRMGESIEDSWRYFGERVGHVHVKDGIRRADGGWDLVLLGEGEVPNRAVIELLEREGYEGYISVEWEKKWHPEIEDPAVALPQFAEKLREWMSDDNG